MQDRTLHTGDLFQHFKGKRYQIVTVATHSENDEQLVIYQALYGDYRTYARPVEMFLSEVDHEKYPDVTQKYRFEKIVRSELNKHTEPMTETKNQTETVTAAQTEPTEEVNDADVPNPWLMKFLDTNTYDEKMKVLKEMHEHITDRLINDLAVVLDVVIPEGEIEERFRHLRICVETQSRFETNRLR